MSVRIWPAPKDPLEVKDYEGLWHKALKGDTIGTSTWVVLTTNSGIVIDSSSKTDDTTTVWLSGGRLGTYDLRNEVVTAGLRTLVQTFRLTVKNK